MNMDVATFGIPDHGRSGVLRLIDVRGKQSSLFGMLVYLFFELFLRVLHEHCNIPAFQFYCSAGMPSKVHAPGQIQCHEGDLKLIQHPDYFCCDANVIAREVRDWENLNLRFDVSERRCEPGDGECFMGSKGVPLGGGGAGSGIVQRRLTALTRMLSTYALYWAASS